MVNEIDNKQVKQQAETIDIFLRFCYNFPLDIKKRFIKYYGEALGNHFYDKFHGYTNKLPNNFYGMIRTFSEMTPDNQKIFCNIINDYKDEV